MVTCDQQENFLSSQKVLLWIFLQKRNLIWRYAKLNGLLVASGLIPLNIELQQDDRTICGSHNTVAILDGYRGSSEGHSCVICESLTCYLLDWRLPF